MNHFYLVRMRLLLALMICIISIPIIRGQSQNHQLKTSIESKEFVEDVLIHETLGTPFLTTLQSKSLLKKSWSDEELIEALYDIESTQESFIYAKQIRSTDDIQIKVYDQYMKGIKVEHGVVKIIEEHNEPILITAEKYPLIARASTLPALSPQEAKDMAIQHTGARQYVWDVLDQYIYDLQQQGKVVDRQKIKDEVDPDAELVWVDDYSTEPVDLHLAYKLQIYALEPLSREWVYVDAKDGRILLRDAIIKHGSGATRYNGSRTFPTTFVTDHYELVGTDPISGVEVETRSLDGVGGLPLSLTAIYDLAVACEDDDDNWTYAEHHPDEFSTTCPWEAANPEMNNPVTCNEAYNDDVALDAHWGAAVVARYWKDRHNRNSYDDAGAKIYSFVHYGDSYDNAFWNGSYMTYGDGSYQGGALNAPGMATGFAPLTSMDVCAHEIGHAICTHTSDLVYQRESGAMNEGFSDIWGAAVENYVLQTIDGGLPYDPFGIGEQIDENDGGLAPGLPESTALRWMDDPKAEGDPDTYGGTNWREPECGEPTLANDYCGVHTNSGVLNKWFYLLVKGSGLNFTPGDGKAMADDEVNDHTQAYSVTGLDYIKAEHITFLAETMLTPNSTFAQMRDASIVAARLLYSSCGMEEESVTNAWYAVGVGDIFAPCMPSLAFFAERNAPDTIKMETGDGGCSSTSFDLYVFGYNVTETIQLSLGGTATEGIDYDISTKTIQMTDGGIESFTITIYNDGVIEADETILISLSAGTYNDQMVVHIRDDDFNPSLGGIAGQELLSETFPTTTIPAEWSSVDLYIGSQVSWFFSAATAQNEGAFISDDTNGTTPTYTSNNIDGHTVLWSPMINARGLHNVHVSFNWWVGGEYDGTVFDFGSFVISLDGGTTYTEIEQYHGPDVGQMDNGTYSMAMPQLDNKNFMLGWKWYNDILVFGSYSFAIDDVLVTADPIAIESDSGAVASHRVFMGDPVHFLSEVDGELIASVTSADVLGCTQTRLVANDTTNDTAPYDTDFHRSSKVIQVAPEMQDQPHTVTMYFKNEEIDGWPMGTDVTALHVLYVTGMDIEDRTQSAIIDNADITIDDRRDTDEYISYTFDMPAGTHLMALTNHECPESLLISGANILTNVYRADALIESDGIIHTGADVGFIAPIIHLLKGFEVQDGLLTITNGNCNE